MTTINNAQELKLAIAELEAKRQVQKTELEEQFRMTKQGLQPANIIKGLFSELVDSSEVKDMLINNTLGMASGFVSKKLLLGATSNPITKLLGSAVQFGIGHLVANNPGGIREVGGRLLKSIFGRKHKGIGKTEEKTAGDA